MGKGSTHTNKYNAQASMHICLLWQTNHSLFLLHLIYTAQMDLDSFPFHSHLFTKGYLMECWVSPGWLCSWKEIEIELHFQLYFKLSAPSSDHNVFCFSFFD